MVPFRSLDDLASLLTRKLSYIPKDVDIVVGIPRSGMIPATMISLLRNIPLLSLESFLSGNSPMGGQRTGWGTPKGSSSNLRRVLIVDDSCNNGIEMERVKALVALTFPNISFLYFAVFSTTKGSDFLDIFLELVEYPRLFEWNILNHPLLKNASTDLDGVLCTDPSPEQNDDSVNYERFIENAPPLFIPQCTIGKIITSRLEKYRSQTVDWLAKNNVQYNELVMLSGYTASQRKKLGLHGRFKAEKLRASGSLFYVESSDAQARQIVELSGIQVYSVETRRMYYPLEIKDKVINHKTFTFRNSIMPRLNRYYNSVFHLLHKSGVR